nr:MAG TPA: hypothetical protein [Caudoviricetes sp.]DAL65393.1 MAG TPA_asm: hypothetical protein [Caudoviricetes sp.]
MDAYPATPTGSPPTTSGGLPPRRQHWRHPW